MKPLFDTLDFLQDAEPHNAPLNMAIDEALLAGLRRPTLRTYRWERPAVSFGYFEKWEAVDAAHPGREAVRRWTGGGVVPHGEDFTYTLLVPAGSPFLKMNAADSYCAIHRCIARTLGEYGVAVTVAENAQDSASRACFEKPVAHDVLQGGQKVAGGAQRRTRFGMMHQGSIQNVQVPEDFAARLAGLFGREVSAISLEDAVAREAERLSREKYSTEEWLRRF